MSRAQCVRPRAAENGLSQSRCGLSSTLTHAGAACARGPEGAGHWLGEASQLIVEGNTFAGFSLVSGGSNIATYQGGYSQHIFMADNVMSDVWAT